MIPLLHSININYYNSLFTLEYPQFPDSPATAACPIVANHSKIWAGVAVRHGLGKANEHSFAMIIASEDA